MLRRLIRKLRVRKLAPKALAAESLSEEQRRPSSRPTTFAS